MSRSFFPNRSGNALPVSTTDDDAAAAGGIRRRLSSSSLNNIPAAAANWSFPRSKSLPSSFSSVGDSIKNCWLWIFAWILSRKPIFATDLEMNEQETKHLESADRGSWKHVFYRMRSEIRRITNSDHSHLPQTYTPKPQTMI
ncbi:uncharacterized protein LOC127117443 [Lathyrus oleraceus]|uniref:Uncharacterized protein n=1 Tax=Pisum sativum TaxID=3888 RepID=A0A9D5B7Z2_PEA|nr:uncharacterized protein LOC127117443 [Pisum sativum]KAI5432534.1 hypothetical protein KIW84_020012 [Pisum sativum]